MALGFPWKKQPGTEEEGGGNRRRDRNCMFRSAAKTIAALESHISFHARGFRRQVRALGGRQRGQMAVQEWQIATLLIVPEKGALM